MKQYIRILLSLLWGIPTPFILTRKEFIKRALYLFLLRLPISNGLADLYALLANVDIEADFYSNTLLVIIMSLLSFFLIPYFTIFNCRVRGAGFRLCYTITFCMGCTLLFSAYNLPSQSGFLGHLSQFILLFIPYAILALFKDKELIGEVAVSSRGKSTGIADIQRLAALANARSRQAGRAANSNVLEGGRPGEKTDSPAAEHEKVKTNVKERSRGDDLEL